MFLLNCASTGNFVHPTYKMSEYGAANGMILAGETEGLEEKPVRVTLCPPEIQNGLIWALTRASSAKPGD
jgi:hypothetical protein